MKLLFIQGGTRVKTDNSGNLYTDGNLNNKIWERYGRYCEKLLAVLKKDNKKYEQFFAEKNFNKIDCDKVAVFQVPDLLRPKKNFFSIGIRRHICRQISEAVKQSDGVIIRSVHNYYTLKAAKACRRYGKPYMIEVVGYAFNVYWWHGGLAGKMMAFFYERKAKKEILMSPYCVYVTRESLQDRYPSNGAVLGCSDVELPPSDRNALSRRIEKIKNSGLEKLTIGTIGWIDIKLKGQRDVIKAIARLKRKGMNRYKYQLVGLGNRDYLSKIIKKYGLENEVEILGGKTREEVYKWLKDIDIYIQPSYSEGLCRSIVEAMSTSCPVIASNVGGNVEMVNNKFLFKPGDSKHVAKILSELTVSDLISEAERSFTVSLEYDFERLNERRDAFYKDFAKKCMEFRDE